MKGACLTSVAFVFQACYGTPQDFGTDMLIEGKVTSKTTGLPIKGIKVSIANNVQYTSTDEKGSFSFYTGTMDNPKIIFEDIDSTENKSFANKDTVLTSRQKHYFLDIALEER